MEVTDLIPANGYDFLISKFLNQVSAFAGADHPKRFVGHLLCDLKLKGNGKLLGALKNLVACSIHDRICFACLSMDIRPLDLTSWDKSNTIK